ncbi:hypothetical protein ACTJKO_07605 [Curtobacterium sp. 22159]|uniref:hypothetical protein n=1 Tax=Curtobacterium sp. 22159 TaxID=3453882 RepID=UPI003F84BA22
MSVANLATNPRAATLTNFSGEGSAEAPAPTLATGGPVPSVTNQVVVRATKANTYIGVQYSHAGITAGQVYSFSGYMATDSLAGTFATYVIWTNASGGTVSVSSGPTAASAAGSWVRMTFDGVTAPAGATGATVVFRKLGSVAAGNLVVATAVMVARAATSPAYGDGATAGWAWTGTPDASSSVNLVVGPPTLTVLDDDALGPRVSVVFTDLAAITQYVTVRRTAGGRTMPVRGGVQLYAVGGAAVLDQEVPFGIDVSYQAEQFDANGVSLGMTDTASVTVDTMDAWVHQPLNPNLSLQVRVRLKSTETLGWESPGDVVYTQGASVGRLINGQRSGIKDSSLLLRLIRPSDAAVLDAMFGTYDSTYPAVLCVRTPPNVPLPPVLFWGCTTPKRLTSGANKLVQYQLDGSEVAPPAPGLVIPTLSRNDIDAAYPTRAARSAAYTSRLARDTDYSLGGTASTS